MKRRLLWLVALAGVVWLYLRRGVRRPQPVVGIPSPDPAEELRRKLDEAKEQATPEQAPPPAPAEPPEPAPAPPAAAPPPPAPDELDAKRRAVHERARSAADEMRRTSSD